MNRTHGSLSLREDKSRLLPINPLSVHVPLALCLWNADQRKELEHLMLKLGWQTTPAVIAEKPFLVSSLVTRDGYGATLSWGWSLGCPWPWRQTDRAAAQKGPGRSGQRSYGHCQTRPWKKGSLGNQYLRSQEMAVTVVTAGAQEVSETQSRRGSCSKKTRGSCPRKRHQPQPQVDDTITIQHPIGRATLHFLSTETPEGVAG